VTQSFFAQDYHTKSSTKVYADRKVNLEVNIGLPIQKSKSNQEEKFYVTLEKIWWRNDRWEKECDINTKVIVIVNCTEETTVSSFVAQCHQQHDHISADKSWRVFFPNNMPDKLVWLFQWEKRKDYLINFMDGEKTLKDIGIGPNSNRLFYYMQTQWKSRDEP
jgi:hypothetical protein